VIGLFLVINAHTGKNHDQVHDREPEVIAASATLNVSAR
jgi:hypothetical protein